MPPPVDGKSGKTEMIKSTIQYNSILATNLRALVLLGSTTYTTVTSYISLTTYTIIRGSLFSWCVTDRKGEKNPDIFGGYPLNLTPPPTYCVQDSALSLMLRHSPNITNFRVTVLYTFLLILPEFRD